MAAFVFAEEVDNVAERNNSITEEVDGFAERIFKIADMNISVAYNK